VAAGFVVDAEVVEDVHQSLLLAVGVEEPARVDKWPGASPALPRMLAGRGAVVLGLILSEFYELILGGDRHKQV
jgi:hypothetical protein